MDPTRSVITQGQCQYRENFEPLVFSTVQSLQPLPQSHDLLRLPSCPNPTSIYIISCLCQTPLLTVVPEMMQNRLPGDEEFRLWTLQGTIERQSFAVMLHPQVVHSENLFGGHDRGFPSIPPKLLGLSIVTRAPWWVITGFSVSHPHWICGHFTANHLYRRLP